MLAPLSSKYTLLVARGNARSARKLGIHSLTPSSPEFPFIAPGALNLTHFYPQQSVAASPIPEGVLKSEITVGLERKSTVACSEPIVVTTVAAAGWWTPETKMWLKKIHGKFQNR